MSQVYAPRLGSEAEGWTCETCLRYNPKIENRRCEICNTWRDLDWECKVCRYKNFAKRSTCKECGGNKPEDFVDQAPISYPGATAVPDYSFPADGYVPLSQNNPNVAIEHPWLCGLCQIENTPKRIVCFECSGHRDRVEVRNRKYDNNPSRNVPGVLGSNNARASHQGNFHSNYSGYGEPLPPVPSEPPVRFEDLSGDWLCKECDNRNFAKRQKCNRCNKPKQHVEVKGAKFDDIKPKLAIPKSAPLYRTRKRSPQVSMPPPQAMDLRRPEDRSKDWSCSSCKNRNFAKRQKCNKCNKPREEVEDNSIRYEDEVLQEPPRGRSFDRRNTHPLNNSYPNINFSPQSHPQPRRVSGHTLSFRRDNPAPPPPKKRKWVDEDKSNDWYCKFCDINNFAKRDKCFRCLKTKKECAKDVADESNNTPSEDMATT